MLDSYLLQHLYFILHFPHFQFSEEILSGSSSTLKSLYHDFSYHFSVGHSYLIHLGSCNTVLAYLSQLLGINIPLQSEYK